MESITLGQISGLLTFVVGFIGAIEFLAYRMRKYIKTTMKDEIEPLKIELNKNSLNTMKNTICNDNIPLSERITVGKEYVEKGGNGAVKIYLHELEKQYEENIRKEVK